MGWISFFTDVSSEMIFPLLPTFLTTVLMAGPAALGWIEGLSETSSSIFKLIAGKWSDRLGKRRFFVWWGYGLSSLMRSLIGLSPNWLVVLGLRFGDRVGKGLRTAPRDSLIALSVPENQRGHAFGYHRMMDHSGAVVGSLIGAGLLFLLPGQFRLIFLLAAVPALIACLLLKHVDEVSPSEQISDTTKNLPKEPLPIKIKLFLVALFVFNLGNATDAFLLLRLQTDGLPATAIPLLWAAFHIIKAGSNSLLGHLSDKVDRRFFVFGGWLLYAIVYLLFSRDLSQAQMIFIFLVYGVFFGLTEGPEKALVSTWTNRNQLGNIFGSYHFIMGISLLPASLIFGYLWQWGGFSLAFTVAGGITLLATIMLGVLFLRQIR